MSNMYDFVTTNNPLAGKCPHGCIYCSTNKFYYPNLINKYSGEIRLDIGILNKKIKCAKGNKDKIVFIVAQNDLFANTIKIEYIETILQKCNTQPELKYFFQTKNPKRFLEFKDKFPVNSILCTTIESDFVPIAIYKPLDNCIVPTIDERINALKLIDFCDIQITIEPIMYIVNIENFIKELKDIKRLTQINIGANTYREVKLVEPNTKQLLYFIKELEKFTKVYLKSNITRLL